jgi:hypothetical protein
MIRRLRTVIPNSLSFVAVTHKLNCGYQDGIGKYLKEYKEAQQYE